MKIGTRLILGFASISIILLVVGLVSYFNVDDLDAKIGDTVKDKYVKTVYLNEIKDNINTAMISTRNIILYTDEANINKEKQLIKDAAKNIQNVLDKLQPMIKNEKGKLLLANIIKARDAYVPLRTKVVDLASQNKNAEATAIMYGDLLPLQNNYFGAIDEMLKFQEGLMDETAASAQSTASSTKMLIIVLLLSGLVISVLIAYFINRSITKPINQAVDVANKISEGNFKVDADTNRKDETGVLLNALKNMVNTINGMVQDVNVLSNDATNGKLDKRADSSKFKGEYHNLVSGINSTLDAIINPLNVTAEYVDRISKGDMPPMIVEEYHGDFNEIKNNLNQCISAINMLIGDTKELANSAAEGKLKFRADSNKHMGEFRNIVLGINNAIDNIAGPLNTATTYMDRIAKGDLPEKITEEYRGDFNLVKVSVNQLVDNVSLIISGIGRITESMQNGQLEDRAHTELFQGDWAKLVQGINNIIESLMAPLNISLKYLEILSVGEIPQLINEDYKGDYNKIKNSINVLITALNNATNIAEQISQGNLNNEIKLRSDGDKLMKALEIMTKAIKRLASDANMLAESAIRGEMSVRADETVHSGDFKSIVSGVNHTLDAVMKPVNEAVDVLKGLSSGDLTMSMVGEYQGDHAILKNSINQTLDSLNELLAQVQITVDEVSRGSIQVSDASTALSQGATEQAASLEEITSSMSEIGSQTRTNAENANQANILTFEAKEAAEKGNKEMEQLNKAMSEITESSKNISKIIKVIDEIAFQTNLLALNAAVEAARAGRHGKGFAVVAEEVRNLAARSAAAAKETSDMIENSIRTVENGSIIAIRTGEALDEIRQGSIKSADIVGEIATMSNEQAQAISQINEGLVQIDKVTQTNTASAEESASASEELSGQASQLRQLLSRFKLRNAGEESISELSMHRAVSGRSRRQERSLPESDSSSWSMDSHDYEPSDIIKLDEDDFGRY